MKKLFILAIVILGFSTASFAQPNGSATASATAVSNATIITPISIIKDADLSFGNIVADANGGTVVLVPAGTRSSADLTLPTATPGTISAAQFTVSGEANASYSIVLPAPFNVVNGGNSMNVGSFVSTPSGSGVIGTTSVINVGATLTVGNNQASGIYTNSTGLVVTVAYN